MLKNLVQSVKSMACKAYNAVKDTALAVMGVASTAVGSAVVASQEAHAALPVEATSAFTALSTAATDVLAAVWPIVGLVLAGFITIKLVKRGASKI